jgi:hypothetical protein
LGGIGSPLNREQLFFAATASKMRIDVRRAVGE